MGGGDRLPDQALADLVMAAALGVSAEAAAVPNPGALLQDPHHPDYAAGHAGRQGGVMAEGGDRVGDRVLFVAITVFKEMLFLAEDGAAQLPILGQQRGARPQQMEGETFGTGRGREAEILGIDAHARAHRGGEGGRRRTAAAADVVATGIDEKHGLAGWDQALGSGVGFRLRDRRRFQTGTGRSRRRTWRSPPPSPRR